MIGERGSSIGSRPATARSSARRPNRATDGDTMTTVRAAITQTTWTGDKESMLDKHEQFARDAAAQGAQVICFQELFYGPYFGITAGQEVLPLRRAGRRPDRAALRRARRRSSSMVMVLPDLRGGADRRLLQHRRAWSTPTARSSASTASTTSRTSTGSGRSSTSAPATSATRSSTPRSARSASTSATTGTSPRAGASSASTARTSSSTRTPPSPASRTGSGRSRARAPPSPTATSCCSPTGSAARTTSTATQAVDFYGTSQVIDPRGNFVGERGSGEHEELLDPRPRHGHGAADARRLAVLPRPPARLLHA